MRFMMAPPMSSVFCPACGQALTIPLHDLAARFPCPRCQTWHTVGDFADHSQALIVSPIASTPPVPPATSSPAVTSPVLSSATAPAPPADADFASAPPPGSAVRSVPDALISGGLHVAGAGLTAARRSTSWLLNLAERIDAWLGDRRAQVLGGAAIVGVLVQLFGAREQRDLWGVVAGGVFLAAIATVALAFVARCRDEATGRFSQELLQERIATFFATLDEFATDFREASTFVRLQLVGRTVVIVGVVAAEALILTLRYDVIEFSPGVIVAALWLTSMGAIAWVWGRRGEGSVGGTAFQSTPAGGTLERGLGVLPPVVSSADRVPLSGDPLVDGLLDHLCTWRPGRLASESEYQERLFRALRRKRRDMKVERERWVSTPEGAKRRIDLVLEASTGRVAVELKSKYSAGACQRAIGQVEEYVETNVRAVVLVLCDPQVNSANVQSLLDKVTKMRERGMPIVAVLAVAQGAQGRLASPHPMLAMQQSASPNVAPSWRAPAVAFAVVTLIAASSWKRPPPGLRALEAPMASSTSALSSATMTGAGWGTAPAGACTATAASSFHLRPTATMASAGPEYAAGTQLTVFEFTGLTRRASKLYRVQTSDGAAGYAFLAPNELSGGCTQ